MHRRSVISDLWSAFPLLDDSIRGINAGFIYWIGRLAYVCIIWPYHEILNLGDAVHFFIEDTTNNLFLLIINDHTFIGCFVRSLNIEKVCDYLASKNDSSVYIPDPYLVAHIPVLLCSSIPVIFGFTRRHFLLAYMSFLFDLAADHEVAVLLLLSLVGWQ